MGDEVWDRACNDNGPGGVCTWCDTLHTVTVVVPCPRCLYVPDECRCNVVGLFVKAAREMVLPHE